MKPFRIIISIAFVIFAIASLSVFIGEKINTDKTVPQITVEEELIEVSLKATDEELLKGVTAFDEKDGDLTGEIIVESISKFTEKGVCKVTYAVCDSNNNIAKATRKIRYKDYESPKFSVSGNLCFSLYSRMDISKMIGATDCLEGNLSSEVIVTSDNYSLVNPGFYSLTASVSNQKGDTSEIELPFIVEERSLDAPVIELSEYLVYTKKGEAVIFEEYIVDVLDAKEKIVDLEVTVESDIDFNKEGTYHVHFYATDEEDRRGHSVLTVIVGE